MVDQDTLKIPLIHLCGLDWIGLGDEQGRAYLRGREEEVGAPSSLFLPLSSRSGGEGREH